MFTGAALRQSRASTINSMAALLFVERPQLVCVKFQETLYPMIMMTTINLFIAGCPVRSR